MNEIIIQPFTELHELDKIVALQATFWHDPSIIVQRNILYSLVNSGGAVHAALCQGKVVGFILSFIGLQDRESNRPAHDNLKLVSQRMTVLPEYRHQGIGHRLKMAQCDYARQLGLNLITWTFDPLISRNAYFNIRKLGAVSRCFIEDYYGPDSPLAWHRASDRLYVEWWIDKRKSSRASVEHYLASAPIINPYHPLQPQPIILIEIPHDYTSLKSPNIIHTWRQYSRHVLPQAFSKGYCITDFVHDGTRSFYVLER